MLRNFLAPRSSILELNAGTGEDAVYFAQQGHNVHATDISAGMQEVADQKNKRNSNWSDAVSFELCSFTKSGRPASARDPMILSFPILPG